VKKIWERAAREKSIRGKEGGSLFGVVDLLLAKEGYLHGIRRIGYGRRG